MRKLQKQRSKEIDALLDFKMHSPMSPMERLPPLVDGKAWTWRVAHLVAGMIFRRRVCSQPVKQGRSVSCCCVAFARARTFVPALLGVCWECALMYGVCGGGERRQGRGRG